MTDFLAFTPGGPIVTQPAVGPIDYGVFYCALLLVACLSGRLLALGTGPKAAGMGPRIPVPGPQRTDRAVI